MLSVSVVLLLAVAVAVLCRWAGLRASHAVVCVLLGFYLALDQACRGAGWGGC